MKNFKLIQLIVRILVPVVFLLIAVTEGKLYYLGGVMVIVVLYYYSRLWANNKSK